MARFFALGPLVLVLCLVLFPQSDSSTFPKASNTPADTTEVTDPSPAHMDPQVTKSSETATSPSPSLTSTPVPKSSETGSSDSPTTMQPTSPTYTALPTGGAKNGTNTHSDSSTLSNTTNTPADTIKGKSDVTSSNSHSCIIILSHSDLHLPIMPCYTHITEQEAFIYSFVCLSFLIANVKAPPLFRM
ncbi:putative protein TPRXL [Sinocyclocheilus rhinocerous]|uniref:putative protein TPRXL n=1 Tax=Sinocyclocheilus rhinocerous TaxID=307959 RepID=UPI0007B959EA|nr:PREDICTED: putative protein TPRXL [Sinocyclocheilus rhinocerous]